jgi:ABC-2 type transport system ATP-binding protein
MLTQSNLNQVVSEPGPAVQRETVLQLAAVTKDLGPVRALDAVSFTIERGEIVALLGPNGAGKTTAVSLMLGLRRPTSGQVTLFGLDPRNKRARVRCGAMLQQSSLPGSLTVREVVNLFRAYYRQPMPAQLAIELALLTDKAKTLIYKLSGGERQRVYFALAVCGNPELLFLDEPSVGMDVQMRRAFWEGIRRFRQDGGTVLLTTHYIEESEALASRVVIIDRGLVVMNAAPADIKKRLPSRRVSFVPLTSFTADSVHGLPLHGLQQADGVVRFVSNEPEEVLGQLYVRGCRFQDLEVTGASLEEAFLELTGRAREDGDG